MRENLLKPPPEILRRRRYIRTAILGEPLLGLAMGALGALIPAIVWVFHSQPDFYFRGWSGVQVHFILLTTAGTALGLLQAGYLTGAQALMKRRICLWCLCLTSLLLTTLLLTPYYVQVFRQQRILTHWPLFFAPAIPYLTVFVCLRRPDRAESSRDSAA